MMKDQLACTVDLQKGCCSCVIRAGAGGAVLKVRCEVVPADNAENGAAPGECRIVSTATLIAPGTSPWERRMCRGLADAARDATQQLACAAEQVVAA